jgi:hypothetical protein
LSGAQMRQCVLPAPFAGQDRRVACQAIPVGQRRSAAGRHRLTGRSR